MEARAFLPGALREALIKLAAHISFAAASPVLKGHGFSRAVQAS